MNNLHRDLAPIPSAAWAQIDEEARRSFTASVAGRRVVDVHSPGGFELAAVGTGHARALPALDDGVQVHQREVRPLVELRVPFDVSRQAVDDVARGAGDADWQPVKDAARAIAFAEDRTIFEGMAAAGIIGLVPAGSNGMLTLPERVQELPDTVARALSVLRLASVGGPYSLLLSSDEYTRMSESTDYGHPIRDHLARLLPDGDIVWAPALTGAVLVSTRGGDYALHLGQDVSIGYLSHDDDVVRLYLEESLTFAVLTDEASVALSAA